MRDRVNILDVNIVWHVEADGGVVENGLHPRLDELVGDLLGHQRGDGEHGDLDLVLFDAFDHLVGAEDLELPDLVPDLFGVVIEHHDHAEAAIAEAVVARQRMPDITHAHDRHIPNAVHLQDVAQAFDQERDGVPGALFAELAEL